MQSLCVQQKPQHTHGGAQDDHKCGRVSSCACVGAGPGATKRPVEFLGCRGVRERVGETERPQST